MPAKKVIAKERKLPVKQLSILAICRFAEPIASTSLFPYLPEMVQSFGVPENEIGKWAGICSGVFSLCQAVMGIPWGMFSDRYGRKYSILLGLSTNTLTTLVWGFSTSLPLAIIARGIAGAGNGNVGIIRTTVAEMVPYKELQPRAFSLMPLVWNLGSTFGPMIGGTLANPYNVRPGKPLEDPNLLQRFPYALPNLVAACFFLVGIATGVLFLEETMQGWKDRPDYGLVLGHKLSDGIATAFKKLMELLHLRSPQSGKDDQHSAERQPLLHPSHDEETIAKEAKADSTPPPSFREVLNRQSILNLIVYTFIALHTMAYDQLLPVFMNYSPIRSHHSNNTSGSEPLKFAGGLGLDHFRIGLISTAYGIFGLVVQFLFYPSVARRFGVLNCLKACSIIFPIAYFITPFAALFPSTTSQIAAIFAIMLLKCCAAIFVFPSSMILMTNSATSLRTLGTLNGIATSAGAVGRALGPAIGGAVFTLGVKRGYVVAPFWLICGIAVVAAVPVWLLVEGEGFGGEEDDEGHISDEDEDVEEEVDVDVLQEVGLEGEAEAVGQPGPLLVPTGEQVMEGVESNRAANSRREMSRTTTDSSHLSLGSALSPYDEETDEMAAGSITPTDTRRPVPGDRARSPVRVMRRVSLPLGSGRMGVGRRYSSHLGQSFGSAGSYHGHG